MHYIVQDGLYNGEGFSQLVQVLERVKLSYSIHKIIPFADIIVPEPEESLGKNIFAFGANTMTNIAKARDWNPGVFTNENFDYRVLLKNLGDNVLNSDAKFSTFGTIELDKPMFIRPVQDSKSFTGGVFEPEDFKQWQNKTFLATAYGEFSTLTPDVMCLIAEPKQIFREIRFFIIDGKISTATHYKFAGQAFYSSEDIEKDSKELVQKVINIWQPSPAYTLDIALLDIEGVLTYKVVEINCINGSAFYAADVSKLIQDLDYFLSRKYGTNKQLV